MSIFSFVRSGQSSTSTRPDRRRGLRHRSSRAIQAACTEALEGRRLLSVSVIDQNVGNLGPSTGGSAQYFGPFISADGRYVAFDGTAPDLISSGLFTPGQQQVYVRDRLQNTNILVTKDQFGASADADSWVADISSDGRYVLFFSNSDNLVSNDADGMTDLFIRDLQTNITTVVSVDPSGQAAGVTTLADGVTPAFPAYLSADARYVGFVSPTDDLASLADNKTNPTAADDTNGADDVFVRDLQTSTTYLTTVSNVGQGVAAVAGTLESFDMSADGAYVVYATDSEDLVAADNPGTTDVFRRNVFAGTTTLISDGGSGPVGASEHVAISADGSTVAYLNSDPSIAGNGSVPQMIVWKGGNSIASKPPSGDPTGVAYGFPALSADGRYVFFRSDSTDIVPGVTLPGVNVFRRDTQLAYTEVVSYGATGGTTNIIDAYDQPYAGEPTVTPFGFASRISVTADGRYVTYADDSTGADPNITTYPGGGAFHAYVRDMLAARPTLLDVSTSSITTASSGISTAPIISADATLVAFVSAGATDLPGGDSAPHVYAANVPLFDDNGNGSGSVQPYINLSAPNVTNAGATSYTFQVTYFSPRPIVVSTLDDNDIYVQIAGNTTATKYKAILVSANTSADAKILTATYRIIPPGGAWDITDNGQYVIHLNAHQVSDQAGFEFPGQDLGTFAVSVPVFPSVGPSTTVSIPEQYLTDNPLSLGFPIDITRDDAGATPATIDYKVIPGSASYPADFTVSSAFGNGLSGTLTLLPGTPATIYIKPVDDAVVEAGETLTILLSNASFGATVPFMQYAVTIVDNDSAGSGTISVSPSSPVQPVNGVAGSTISIENGVTTVTAPETIVSSYGPEVLPITISRADTGTVGLPVSFNYTIYSTPSDSAVAGVNFVQASGTLSFAANESTKDLLVHLLHDQQVTGDRTFTVVLTNDTTGLQVGGDSIHVVIRDVDSSVQFSTSALTTNDDAGTLDVTVTRVGNITPGSKVRLTFGGTAIAGRDYTVVSDGTVDTFGDITFAPGETSKILHLQLISQDFNPGASRTIDLGLANPRALSTSDPFAYDTVLGTPSAETLTVQNVDATSPQVSSLNFKSAQGRIPSIQVGFNEAVFGSKKLSNYALFSLTPDGKLGQILPLAKAKYNRTTHVVTLTPAQPLPLNQMYQLNVNGSGTLADTHGNKLDGDANGTPRGSFNGVFGFGRALSYADADNDLVSFSLKGRGNIRIASLNDAVTVDVLNTDPGETSLLGSVSKRKGGDGKTHLSLLRLRGATFDANESKFDADIRALKRKHK